MILPVLRIRGEGPEFAVPNSCLIFSVELRLACILLSQLRFLLIASYIWLSDWETYLAVIVDGIHSVREDLGEV